MHKKTSVVQLEILSTERAFKSKEGSVIRYFLVARKALVKTFLSRPRRLLVDQQASAGIDENQPSSFVFVRARLSHLNIDNEGVKVWVWV